MQAAYYALHYGCDYLAWSIKSIQDAVDEIHIFYVDRPSYGHSQGAKCPDSRAELVKEAHRFSNKPIHWHDVGPFRGEGAHRGFAIQKLRARGAHQILVVDADEVWLPGSAQATIYAATRENRAQNWMAKFVHFIRSTKYAVTDHFTPVRVIDLRHKGQATLSGELDPVLHFGYAQREALIRYKWTCHGHQQELRPGWLKRFMDWKPEDRDLHPVVHNLWPQAKLIDEDLRKGVEAVLEDHPFLELDKIV